MSQNVAKLAKGEEILPWSKITEDATKEMMKARQAYKKILPRNYPDDMLVNGMNSGLPGGKPPG